MSIYDRDLLTGRNKVETAIERIRTFCAGKKVLVAFSGGKDSQCCYHLAKLAGDPFDAQYSITRFEPPELIAFIRQHYPEVTFRRAYKMSLVNEIAKRGMPNRWVRYCCKCKHCKTEGYDIAIIGIRWAESSRRRARWTMFGQKQDKSYYVCPICDWSDAEVWEFLNSNEIQHCRLYDEGYHRIGCVCCPLAPASNARDIARYPKFVAMLKVGFMKFLERNDIKSAKTNELIAKYRTDPDKYFGNWLKYGATEGKKIEDEPCLFAGTGFSESDGANLEGADIEAKGGVK
jgi:phosphoadenosine phosphosulfate reductase